MQAVVEAVLVLLVWLVEQHRTVVAQELTRLVLQLLVQRTQVAVLVAVALAVTMLAQQVAQVSL
jgi:hypothetical protein